MAVQLLRLRSIAEQTPDQPAERVVPAEWVRTLGNVRRRSDQSFGVMTISQFVKHLAGLGGHLGRKCDGRPGWITLWRGLEKLLLILRGVRASTHNCG